MEHALTSIGLTVGYNGHAVLDGLDLTLDRGTLTCLLGANGRGKSTLLRTLAGSLAPLRGRIVLDGVDDLASLSPRRLARRVAIVYTDRTAAGALTVAELVALGRQPHTGFFGRLDSVDRRAVAAALESVGIAALADRYVATLSDGERQKATIARALAQDCDIILLDEPTSFLDVASRLETFALLRSLAREQGKAILLSTHDVTEALDTCDRAWVITPDSTLAEGSVDSLIADGTIAGLFAGTGVDFDPVARRFTIGL